MAQLIIIIISTFQSVNTTMTRLFFFLTLLLLAIGVTANTEQVRFVYDHVRPVNSTVVVGQLADDSQGKGFLNVFRSSHVQTITPSFKSEGHDLYQIAGIPGRMYEVRVCWAASDPLQFSLEYVVDKGLLKISYSPEYYSHLSKLQEMPLPASYEVVMNPILFSVLPSDILVVIGQVVVGGLGAYVASRFLVKHI